MAGLHFKERTRGKMCCFDTRAVEYVNTRKPPRVSPYWL